MPKGGKISQYERQQKISTPAAATTVSKLVLFWVFFFSPCSDTAEII